MSNEFIHDRKYLNIAGNVHLAYYIEAAELLGIKYDVIVKSLVARFETNGHHWFIVNASVPINSEPSSFLSRNKGRSYKVFQRDGIPTAEQVDLLTEDDALDFYRAKKNIVIKPARNIGGCGITILPQSEEEVVEGYQFASSQNIGKERVKALAEEFVNGTNYRLLVLGDKVIGIVRRRAAHVTGNGKNTIVELIDIKNRMRKADGNKAIKFDEQSMLKLKFEGLSETYVPGDGEEVEVRFNSNLSTGGSTEECAAEVHPYYQELAVRATKALGLKLGGVDLIAEDVTNPDARAVINEVNTNPGLRLHYMVDVGEIVPVALDIMRYIATATTNGPGLMTTS